MSALYFDARIDNSQLQRDIAQINKDISGLSNHMKKEGREMDNITSRLGAGLAGAFSVFAAGSFIKDIARVRGEFQQLEVAFETMLGSKEKSDKLMAEVVDFAATTPFELSEVASGAKQLLAYGTAAEDIIPTLKSLGDVSAGLSVPIERLILNYGQVRTQLKLTGRELRDFQVAGVPIVAELAKNLNVSEQAIQDMVSAGKIGFADVEKAFQSMTNEGGRFSNLMEKQALTITGLASNFADAWDRMLNSIGQENEGIIAGSIQGAITLVENYEEVIKILKVLVATYGAYKAAVIATAVVERAAAASGAVRAWINLARGIKSAKDAQIAFNLASSANPYGIILASIAALVSYLVIFRKETKTTQDYIEDLNDSIEGIGSQVDVDDLIGQYNNLQNKTNKTAKEQEELNRIVGELAKQFPSAISAVDAYGKAIELSGEKIDELNNKIKNNKRELAKDNLADSQEQVNEKLAEANRLLDEANAKQIKIYDPKTGLTETRDLTDSQIQKRREQADELFNDVAKLQESITKLENQFSGIGVIDVEKFKKQHSDLFKDISTQTKEQAEETKNSLEKLLVYQFGDEIANTIKSQIDVLNNHLALPTIQKQIDQTIIDLKKAQTQLESMRAPGSISTTTQITDKEEEIKALQEKLDALTGVSKKEAEKRLKEQQKAEQERLKALTQFHEEELNLERSLQASKIAIMKEGAERKKAEAELAYDQELDRINQQQQAFLETWNASQGFEPGNAGFITELPDAEVERFTQLRINAEARKNQQIEEINRNAAKEVKAIWQDVNAVYLNDTEKEIASVNSLYEELIKKAKEAGIEDTTDIYAAWIKAVEEANIDSGMRQLQFEEEVELQRAEISTQGFNRELLVEKKKLEITKKYAQQKIGLLKKSGKEESQQDIELLQLFIKSANEGLEELNEQTLSDSIFKIGEMAAAMKGFSDTVFGADSQLSSMFDELSNGAGILANIASGNFIGAASGILQTIAGWYQQTVTSAEELTQAERETREEAIRINDLYRERLLLLQSLGLLSPTEAAIQDVDLLNQKLDEGKESMDDYQQNFLRNGESTSATIKEMLDAVYGEDWGAAEMSEAMSDWDAFFQSYLKIVGGTAYTNHPLSAFNWIPDKEQFAKDINDLLGIASEIEAVKEKERKRLTQTTAESITDSIIDGFRNGYESAADFADTFEDYMRDAMINAMAIQYLEGPMKIWRGHFAEFMEDGIIDPEEREKLQNGFYDAAGNWVDGWNQMVNKANEASEILKDTTGIDLFEGKANKQSGLTGQIKGITEETAGLIAGQFTAMREIGQKQYLTGLEQLDAINQSVTQLERIADNTKYNRHLEQMSIDLSDMNRKIQKDL